MSRRTCVFGIAAVAAAAIGGFTAIPPLLASHAWSTYHWSRTGPLGIRLGDNVGAKWDTYLRTAAGDWTAAADLDVLVAAGGTSSATCAPTYGRVEVCAAKYGSNGWLGIGNVWISGGHIVQGTVQLNNSYFSQARYNKPAWHRFVMCQEIGHVLGLDHQDVNHTNANLGSCMDYTNDPTGTLGTNGTLSNRQPNRHDFDQLAAMYQHLDGTQLSSTRLSSSSAAQAPAGARGRRLGEARGTPGSREWGRAVAADARGRPRLFVRNLGDGDLVATFVIWADEADEHGAHEH